MFKKLLLITFTVILIAANIPVGKAQATYSLDPSWNLVDVYSFQATEGDRVIVDVANNVGYLVNDSSKIYTTFPVLTGQKRFVYYLGLSYFAATPERNWVVKEEVIQSDRVTFSKSGRFLRLYTNGKDRTSYGIHGYKYFDTLLATDNHYRSYGCILVADGVLTVIEKSFAADSNVMPVTTTSSESALPWMVAL